MQGNPRLSLGIIIILSSSAPLASIHIPMHTFTQTLNPLTAFKSQLKDRSVGRSVGRRLFLKPVFVVDEKEQRLNLNKSQQSISRSPILSSSCLCVESYYIFNRRLLHIPLGYTAEERPFTGIQAVCCGNFEKRLANQPTKTI